MMNILPKNAKIVRYAVAYPYSDRIKKEFFNSLHCFGDEIARASGMPIGIWDIHGDDTSSPPSLEVVYDTKVVGEDDVMRFLNAQGIVLLKR